MYRPWSPRRKQTQKFLGHGSIFQLALSRKTSSVYISKVCELLPVANLDCLVQTHALKMLTKSKDHVQNKQDQKEVSGRAQSIETIKGITKRKENNILMGKKISIVLERRGTHDKVFKFYCFSATNRKKKFFCTGLITYTTFNYRKMALLLSSFK